MRSLVEQQRLLQVARICDFLNMAVWPRRIAFVAALDSLTLDAMASLRAFAVRVEYGPLPHDSSLVQL
jgi:hypothetical protein